MEKIKKKKFNKKIVIIGAGPAGLTAAYEIQKKIYSSPFVFEEENQVGGISKTIKFKGYRMDIGGHRFFSKYEKIMNWWTKILPINFSGNFQEKIKIKYQNQENELIKIKNNKYGQFLIRSRLSRIFFLGKFFDYPISLKFNTIINLGFFRMIKIISSYFYHYLFPIRKEKSLEDFIINRFGKVLYKTFFEDYTEKVWGIKCSMIPKEWGQQRIKTLSISSAITHAIKKIFTTKIDLSQKKTKTSLIENFLYPKFGPGQMWEKIAHIIKASKGKIFLNSKVVSINFKKNKIISITVENNNKLKIFNCTHVISTMPVKDLIQSFNGKKIPKNIYKISNNLPYRDFITIGLLVKKLHIRMGSKYIKKIKDNWIYIQEKSVKLGRIQIFNNWSPYLVKDKKKIWLGLEYFCNENDLLWKLSDTEISNFAINELCFINFIKKRDVIMSNVVRVKKAYPAYFGTYNKFYLLKKFINKIDNLYLIGRNGMHKYNNQDHSMLTAMQAVENIKSNIKNKDNIWAINTEDEYHEEK